MKKANCTYKIALEKAFLVGMQNICTDQSKILQKWWLSSSQLKKKQVQKFSTYKTKRGDILLGDNVYLELSMLPGRNWWDTLLFSLEFKGSLAGVCALPTLSCFGRSVSRTVLFKYLHGKEQDFQNLSWKPRNIFKWLYRGKQLLLEDTLNKWINSKPF